MEIGRMPPPPEPGGAAAATPGCYKGFTQGLLPSPAALHGSAAHDRSTPPTRSHRLVAVRRRAGARAARLVADPARPVGPAAAARPPPLPQGQHLARRRHLGLLGVGARA